MSTLFLAIPLTIFVLFILPVWLWLHYNNRNGGQQLSANERQHLIKLLEDTQQMQSRIRTLEQILDTEHPEWRNR